MDETSIIGHAALIKQPVVIADAYDLPATRTSSMNAEFDERYGYRRRSMLVVPMVDQLDHVMGVLLFINRKTDPTARITSKEAADRYVVEYSDREVRLARSLASQAAVAIENTKLYAQIERTLESFVKASVSAIDLRDPATAGHSLRVAALATGLAEAVERAGGGPYRDVHFTPRQLRELRFAALLHDFGKVAVREDVLLKAKKLPPVLWERIEARFDLIRSNHGARVVSGHGRTPEPLTSPRRWPPNSRSSSAATGSCRDANEPSVLDAPAAAELLEICPSHVRAVRRHHHPLSHRRRSCTSSSSPKGTLDDSERAEIESHVTKTFQFLSHIPWTDDLKNMVDVRVRPSRKAERQRLSETPRGRRHSDSDAADHCRRHVRRAHGVGSSVQASGHGGQGARHSPVGSESGPTGCGARERDDGKPGVPDLLETDWREL